VLCRYWVGDYSIPGCVVTRIGRWLRAPIKVKSEDWDWREFGRSFGRFAGGYLDSGEKDTPSARAWDRGGQNEGDGPPTPRWSLILGLVIGMIFVGGLLYFAAMAGAL
jgi:hypothetical protein